MLISRLVDDKQRVSPRLRRARLSLAIRSCGILKKLQWNRQAPKLRRLSPRLAIQKSPRRGIPHWVSSRAPRFSPRTLSYAFFPARAETPSRSRSEMEALAVRPGVWTEIMVHGKLSVHEEFPDEVAAFVGPFLSN